MAMIVLSNGLKLTNAAQLEGWPEAKVKRMISADDLTKDLIKLRCEWEVSTGGKLDAVTVNLSMLFDDLYYLVNGEAE